MVNTVKKRSKLTIDRDKCKGCLLCIEVCPQGALSESKGINQKGFRYVELEHPEKCTGCGMCVIMCPDCAIEIPGGEDKK